MLISCADLTPFAKTQEWYWKSSGVRETGVFGYEYGETQEGWGSDSGSDYQGEKEKELVQLEKHRKKVAQKVYALYGTTFSQMFESSLSPSSPSAGMWDWKVRVRIPSRALARGTSFQVLIFLGTTTTTMNAAPNQVESPHYVGCVSAFVNSVPARCGNCRARADEEKGIEGVVYLNEHLTDLGSSEGLEGMRLEVEGVERVLSSGLRWAARPVRFLPLPRFLFVLVQID